MKSLQSGQLDLPGITFREGSSAACSCYNLGMRIASGKVVAGRVELDGELPEGASVTVLALEGDETFEADTETEKMLLESMAEGDNGRTTPFTDFLSELRSRE
jgi:hypothetical protein